MSLGYNLLWTIVVPWQKAFLTILIICSWGDPLCCKFVPVLVPVNMEYSWKCDLGGKNWAIGIVPCQLVSCISQWWSGHPQWIWLYLRKKLIWFWSHKRLWIWWLGGVCWFLWWSFSIQQLFQSKSWVGQKTHRDSFFKFLNLTKKN